MLKEKDRIYLFFFLKIILCLYERGAISGDNTVEAYERLHRAQTQLQELEDESTFWSEKLRLIERSIANTLDDITLQE